MSERTNTAAAWVLGLMLLAAGVLIVAAQLEAQTILGVSAQERPALFKLILAIEAVGAVGLAAALMLKVRELPRRLAR
jgi:hypothetical protein